MAWRVSSGALAAGRSSAGRPRAYTGQDSPALSAARRPGETDRRRRTECGTDPPGEDGGPLKMVEAVIDY